MPSDGSESDGSDVKMQSALPKMTNKKMLPTADSPTEDLLKKKADKKLTTKIMIVHALIDLKSRKGVSLYAIKKYIADRYSVDTEKLNYQIKKSIKSAVEDGTIIQTKGIGASGSFKVAPVKEKKPKLEKPKKPKTEKTEKTKDLEKKKDLKEKLKKTEAKSLKPKMKLKEEVKKPVKLKKKIEKEKPLKEKKDGVEKAKKVKNAKDTHTPSKKKPIMKRKSIGSIIKPPKMKPKAKM